MKRGRSCGAGELILRPRSRLLQKSREEATLEYLNDIITNDDVARDAVKLLKYRPVTRRIISEATIGSSTEIAERKSRMMKQQQLLEELGAVEMKDYLEHHFNDLTEQVELAPPMLRSRLHEVHNLPRAAAAHRIQQIIEEYDRMIAGATDPISQVHTSSHTHTQTHTHTHTDTHTDTDTHTHTQTRTPSNAQTHTHTHTHAHTHTHTHTNAYTYSHTHTHTHTHKRTHT